MTLKDLGNLGEFVGAIGVVVSLVYLALQIHQNTRHVSERLQRGSADGTTLTPADSQRFALLMQEFFFSYRALSTCAPRRR